MLLFYYNSYYLLLLLGLQLLELITIVHFTHCLCVGLQQPRQMSEGKSVSRCVTNVLFLT